MRMIYRNHQESLLWPVRSDGNDCARLDMCSHSFAAARVVCATACAQNHELGWRDRLACVATPTGDSRSCLPHPCGNKLQHSRQHSSAMASIAVTSRRNSRIRHQTRHPSDFEWHAASTCASALVWDNRGALKLEEGVSDTSATTRMFGWPQG